MSDPLFGHEDRDFIHEIAETFYRRVTTPDKERADKLWDLAEQVQQYINQERGWNTIKSAPTDGTWILVPYEYYDDGIRFAAVHWNPKFEIAEFPSPDEATWIYKGAWTDEICIDDETGRVRSFNPTLWTDIPPLTVSGGGPEPADSAT